MLPFVIGTALILGIILIAVNSEAAILQMNHGEFVPPANICEDYGILLREGPHRGHYVDCLNYNKYEELIKAGRIDDAAALVNKKQE